MMEFALPAFPSASPGFSFASPSSSFRRSIASSPTSSSASYGAPSFLDSTSPLLPRRSPRLNSRVLSSFSPSPSLFNRTLSAFSPSPTPSTKRLRAEPLYDLSHSLPDDAWDSHVQHHSTSPTASSQSTPIPSTMAGEDRAELEGRANSDRASERSLRAKREREANDPEGDDGETGELEQRDSSVEGSYPDEQVDLQRDSSALSAASTASKQHARLSQLQQQLLRAASGADVPPPANKRVKKEESDDDEKTTDDDRPMVQREDHWPQSSASSSNSSSSFPSLSSLSTTFHTPEIKTSPSRAALSPLSPASVASTLSTASRADRSGESCHQCKTRRLPSDLIYCSARHLKKGRARKKKKERLCRKKYCARCFPEHDTRVLTDAGFLFLKDIEARLSADERVRYACYDASTQSIVYTPGKLVYVDQPPTRWVDFTQAGTRRLWDATSDDYGATVSANCDRAGRLTLRTTPEHDMYVQLCTQRVQTHDPRQQGSAAMPSHKMRAVELAPGYQCDCDAAGLTCTHGHSQYRMYTGAASGLHTTADAMSVSDCDERSPVAALGLRTADELDAFLELFGYWLGSGSMSHDSITVSGQFSSDAVSFTPCKTSDRVYLCGLLDRLHLQNGHHFSSSESGSQLQVRITEQRWCRFFDDEFGVQRSSSRHHDNRRALLEQGMHSTQRRPSVSATAAASMSVASSTVADSDQPSDWEVDSSELGEDGMSTTGSDDDADALSSTQPVQKKTVPAAVTIGLTGEGENEDDAVKSVKRLPDWVLFRLDTRQLRLVIEGLQQADGYSAADTMQDSNRICARGVGFRDQLIHACVHAGYSAYFELNTRAGEVCGYNAVPDQHTIYSEEEMEAALVVDSTRQFQPVVSQHDSWWVCYSEDVSELLPAQDVRFDGKVCRSGQAIAQAAAIATQPGDRYDKQRDGRVWCVSVEHSDALIFVQRAHCNGSGVVTKVGRTMIVGNCLQKFYGEQPPARRENGTTVLEFECPSCRIICQCAACRKRQQLAEVAAGGDKQEDSEEVDQADGGQVELEEDVGSVESDMLMDDGNGDELMGDGSTSRTALTVSDVVEPCLTSTEV